MNARPNRFAVDIYYPEDAQTQSTDRSHWVTLTGEGGCELTIFTKSAEHAARIASAINEEPVLMPSAPDNERRAVAGGVQA